MFQRQPIMELFVRTTEQITRIVYINLLWWLGLVAGGVIFGFMPATTSAHTIVRRQAKFDLTGEVFWQFWRNYRAQFIQTNCIGGIWFIIFFIFAMNIRILWVAQTQWAAIMLVITAVLLLLSLIAFVIFFPIYVRYSFPTVSYVRNSFLIAGVQPIRSLVLVVSNGAIIMFSVLVPPILLFLTAGILIYLDDTIMRKGLLRNAELEQDDMAILLAEKKWEERTDSDV